MPSHLAPAWASGRGGSGTRHVCGPIYPCVAPPWRCQGIHIV
ncbi:hypothetical protein HMPREF1316_1477 [Olsenella profusa F0195]|uniref:Uncharacterized protein n=1 Tax=Olsenella profusa F0195 TaxID=1125712 RepID=U2VBM0_9ACTN|nr:hypothetical protein HMPREF1316_1477 [Olsenella profusa F0195]